MRKRSATPPASRKAQTSENTGKIFDQVLFYISLNLGSKKNQRGWAAECFVCGLFSPEHCLKVLSQLFEGRFSPRGCKEGRRVIIGISKGGGGRSSYLWKSSAQQMLWCLQTGLHSFIFPQCPLNFIGQIPKYIEKHDDNALRNLSCDEDFGICHLKEWFCQRLFKAFKPYLPPTKYLLELNKLLTPLYSDRHENFDKNSVNSSNTLLKLIYPQMRALLLLLFSDKYMFSF